MAATVYIETTVISYLTARPTRDIVLAARQQLTREWWHESTAAYVKHVSALVLREISRGDSKAAARRRAAVEGLPILGLTETAFALSETLLIRRAVPAGVAEDALHIATAAAHGMDYLATWNFAHIANAIMRQRIEFAVREAGFRCPVICTPEELVER